MASRLGGCKKCGAVMPRKGPGIRDGLCSTCWTDECKKCGGVLPRMGSNFRESLCPKCWTVSCTICGDEVLKSDAGERDGLCRKCFRRFRRTVRVINGGGAEQNRRRH